MVGSVDVAVNDGEGERDGTSVGKGVVETSCARVLPANSSRRAAAKMKIKLIVFMMNNDDDNTYGNNIVAVVVRDV
jgi:hypothetical protein